MGFSSKLDGVTLSTNTANVFTPILEYEVPAGIEVHFPKVQRMVCKLYSDAGGSTEIDEDSQLYWAYKKSSAIPYYKPLTVPVFYVDFKNLSLSDQADRDKQVLIEVDSAVEAAIAGKPGVKFKQDSVIALLLKSSDTVNWTKSYVSLPDTKVRM